MHYNNGRTMNIQHWKCKDCIVTLVVTMGIVLGEGKYSRALGGFVLEDDHNNTRDGVAEIVGR